MEELNSNSDPIQNTSTVCTGGKMFGHRVRLLDKLGRKQPALAAMYSGGLRVLEQIDNPDRFALAAHSLRELMEKFPRYANIEIRPSVSLISKVNELGETWDTALGSSCRQNGEWDGAIDPKLGELLRKLEAFFKWHRENFPSKTRKITQTFRELDPSRTRAPQVLEEMKAKMWREMNEYFQGVAHHGKTPEDEAEFLGYLQELERFLIEIIEPRVFDHQEEIDRILAEH